MGWLTLYRYFDEDGRLLYVGITGTGPKRSGAHARDADWWTHAVSATFMHGEPAAIRLAERLAIWTECPMYNTVGRVSTARRQEMRAALNRIPRNVYISQDEAAKILGLDWRVIGIAVRMGFIQCDFRRAYRFTHEQLEAFIGETDGPTHVGVPPIIHHRFARTA